jgi:acetyl-CoA synthetase
MTNAHHHPAPQIITATSRLAPLLSHEDYLTRYKKSVENPDAYWDEQAEALDWFSPYHTVQNSQFDGEVQIRWFEGGTLNVSHNCLDRHLATRGNQVAILWEGDNPSESRRITYRELHQEVCRFANGLKAQGVTRGDRVTIYMPMIPEAAVAMLACTRIGAIHSVVFGGFSPEALRGRIEDCQSSFIITADEGLRGGKSIPLKANVDQAIASLSWVQKVIIYPRTGAAVAWQEGRDIHWQDAIANQSTDCPAEVMESEDPLFILYTSGSTGKPKGILHTTAGYLLYALVTFRDVFDYHEGEVFWCTADIGWVTGHSYSLYAPLANGATTLMFEGVPNYPDYSRFWQIIDTYQVAIFYTAPTAIRALMKQGDELVKTSSRQSLRLLGSVGEPINPEAWLWYFHVIGEGRCPIVDTWWQTETGGHLITPLAGTGSYKAGSAMQPYFGIEPVLLDAQGKEIIGAGEGSLCIRHSWPGQARSIWGDHARFRSTYFSQFAGYYFSGDGCQRDADGHYWITGRMDDVLNVSGHRLGTAEIESALVGHYGVAEAAVVGYPHDIKGQGILAFVVMTADAVDADAVKNEAIIVSLKAEVVKEIGAIARPDIIVIANDLPKPRSGKIMRRILRKIAEGQQDFGDVSTLLNPDSVAELWQKAQQNNG